MNFRPLSVLVLLASGCAGSLDVFPEKSIEDTGGAVEFDPGAAADTGMSGGSTNGGSGSGTSGDGSSGSGSGDGSSGDSTGSGSGDSSTGSGSGDDTSGSGSGDEGSGSGSSGSGSSGSGSTGGSGSSGSGSTGGSGSSGSGSTGGTTGSGSGGGTASYGTGRYSQKVGFELYPGSYPCQYEWDVTMTAASTYCSGCDFVMNGTFTYNSSASSLGASYCSAGTVFSALIAHDSDYWGSMPTALYYDPSYFAWYPLDYAATYSGGNWSWGAGTYNYYYLDWYTFYAYYYTNYGRMNATIY